jgi:hypothetical protein
VVAEAPSGRQERGQAGAERRPSIGMQARGRVGVGQRPSTITVGGRAAA